MINSKLKVEFDSRRMQPIEKVSRNFMEFRCWSTRMLPDRRPNLLESPLSAILSVFTVRLRAIGVNRCIYMVMTPVLLAVQSARTRVFVCSDTVCFEIRGSVYQRGLRNFRSRERRVQREPTTEVISIPTSKRT